MSVGQLFGTYKQIKQQKKQYEAEVEREEIRSASQENQDRANLRKAAREARIQRARVLQASESLGTGGSTKEISALSSVSQQQSQNFANVATQQATAQGITTQNQRIADAARQQQIGRDIVNISGQAMDFAKMFTGA